MIRFLEEKEYPIVYGMLCDYLFYSKKEAQLRLNDHNTKLVKTEENKIIGFLLFNEKSYQIHDYNLSVASLLNVGVHVDYRNRNHSKDLLDTFEYYVKQKNLISSLFTYQSKFFAKYGYFKVYDVHRFTIPKVEFINMQYKNISVEFSVNELNTVYQTFVKSFKCFMNRDMDYYEALLARIKAENKRICMYRGKNNACEGYAIYNYNKNGICKVDEIIYLNASSLKHMLCFISESYFDVVVDVSEYELINKVFKHATFIKDRSCMIKVNHLGLFNKLYNKKAKSMYELHKFLSDKCYFQDILNY